MEIGLSVPFYDDTERTQDGILPDDGGFGSLGSAQFTTPNAELNEYP
jgi:hypothetical protein